eukprot:2466705-Pyramimonas_sp.AAC.1
MPGNAKPAELCHARDRKRSPNENRAKFTSFRGATPEPLPSGAFRPSSVWDAVAVAPGGWKMAT